MNLSFSQRNGILPVKKEFQINSMDDDLRNAIWNVILRNCFESIASETMREFSKRLWELHFKLPIDTIPSYLPNAMEYIRTRYMKMKYNQIYDFSEFILFHFPWHFDNELNYIENLNFALQREFSGHRLVAGCITPITSKDEIEAIEVATVTPMSTVNEHILTANKYLSNKDNPDYRNSIKESISAVESICKKIANDPDTTAGKALNKIEEQGKIKINSDMKDAFKKLYHYTSDSGGIRHSLTDGKTPPDFDDAKFMLVSCSAFVNYLVSKASKSGINLA